MSSPDWWLHYPGVVRLLREVEQVSRDAQAELKRYDLEMRIIPSDLPYVEVARWDGPSDLFVALDDDVRPTDLLTTRYEVELERWAWGYTLVVQMNRWRGYFKELEALGLMVSVSRVGVTDKRNPSRVELWAWWTWYQIVHKRRRGPNPFAEEYRGTGQHRFRRDFRKWKAEMRRRFNRTRTPVLRRMYRAWKGIPEEPWKWLTLYVVTDARAGVDTSPHLERPVVYHDKAGGIAAKLLPVLVLAAVKKAGVEPRARRVSQNTPPWDTY